MESDGAARVGIALIHHPVLGKRKEIIGSAVTNLDLHDIARIARTYGIFRYYVVTPYEDQQELVREILRHWQEGHGSRTNPARKEAFSLVRLQHSLQDVVQDMTEALGEKPVLVTTSAVKQENIVGYAEARRRIETGQATLLVFGTAHGLAPEITAKTEYSLPPIGGGTGYNHLSVRSATAIICDRLLGEGSM